MGKRVARQWLDRLPSDQRRLLRPAPVPDWTEPMLATLTHDLFSDPNWLYERKLDGERCLTFREGRTLRLLSRNRSGWRR